MIYCKALVSTLYLLLVWGMGYKVQKRLVIRKWLNLSLLYDLFAVLRYAVVSLSLLSEWCKVGLGICYDLSFPELAALYAKRGNTIVLYHFMIAYSWKCLWVQMFVFWWVGPQKVLQCIFLCLPTTPLLYTSLYIYWL